MPSQLTVTAKTGPAQQNTAFLITPITRMDFDFANRVVHVYEGDSQTPVDYDLVGVTTTTFTWAGANCAVVIS